ncbi:chain length determinant protein (polysaccharide antigen chain regulator) [Pseudomonas linyingensis]|uniref:Chain length determinant protein (Polysaccharide antigen chain regulator) n=1 Tax=Pseudomonas linyingensis TaxID=915471 RepID=A0A1H6TTI3_9PSED|nr:Wzz/FepE/Etk N-terminal domain-containing protein [Pseudomonas linyingensis]SEI82566.1 chain length determinant protein (polysaccharide antigen chain regulator) [Pseudomonas linyingensis]
MEQAGNPARYDVNEIDLRELFTGLWTERLLILLVTLLVGAGAAVYAFLSSPVYEAKSSLLPPRQSDIASYNLGRKIAKLPEFKVEDVYGIFIRNLTSEAARRSFFREVYLPSLSEDERQTAQDTLWRLFNEKFSAKAPDVKNRPDFFEVRVEYKDPELAAKWSNIYVERAAELARNDMQQNVLQEIDTRVQEIDGQIEVLRTAALKQREDRVARLKEALVVADEVGMEAPQVTPGRIASDGELSSFVDGSLMYMRGAKAIRAELQVLEARQSDDPFISKLRGLQSQLVFLKGIEVKPGNVSVFTLDSAAEVPETPVKPKKVLILTLGIVIGGMLGVFVALVRYVMRKGKAAI